MDSLHCKPRFAQVGLNTQWYAMSTGLSLLEPLSGFHPSPVVQTSALNDVSSACQQNGREIPHHLQWIWMDLAWSRTSKTCFKTQHTGFLQDTVPAIHLVSSGWCFRIFLVFPYIYIYIWEMIIPTDLYIFQRV